jgi:hypothetical protein
MINLTSSLNVDPDSGLMKAWASSGYNSTSMYDDLFDGEVSYNVHMTHLRRINSLKIGDLVETVEGDTALVIDWATKDMQGFNVYKVMIDGKEFFYSSLELNKIGE